MSCNSKPGKHNDRPLRGGSSLYEHAVHACRAEPQAATRVWNTQGLARTPHTGGSTREKG